MPRVPPWVAPRVHAGPAPRKGGPTTRRSPPPMARTRTRPAVQVTYHRDASISRLAAVAAAAAAVGASAVAVVVRRSPPARSALVPPEVGSNGARAGGDGAAAKTGFEMAPTEAGDSKAGATKKPNPLVRKVDVFQQRHAWAGVPFAVVKKF